MNDLRRLRLLWATIALVLPAAALAGGKATFKSVAAGHSTTTTLTWRDGDNARLRIAGNPGYFILRDGKAYSVFDAGGTPRVMDMGALTRMMQGFAGRGQDKRPTNPFASIGSVEATGATDTVAGIEGRVYRMHWTDGDGDQQTGEALLTDDALAIEMTRAYFGSLSAMYDSDAGQKLRKGLPNDDRGLLRVGDAFRVQSIERAEPPASTFELPAEPMDLQQMMGGMGRH